MNDDTAAVYSDYVRTLADLLELRDWRFSVAVEPLSESRWLAECTGTYGRRHACITIAPTLLDKSLDEIRVTIAHELVHCHTTPIRNQLDNIEAQLGKAAYTTIYNSTTDVLELATEALANALAPHLPLPPKIKGGDSDADEISCSVGVSLRKEDAVCEAMGQGNPGSVQGQDEATACACQAQEEVRP